MSPGIGQNISWGLSDILNLSSRYRDPLQIPCTLHCSQVTQDVEALCWRYFHHLASRYWDSAWVPELWLTHAHTGTVHQGFAALPFTSSWHTGTDTCGYSVQTGYTPHMHSPAVWGEPDYRCHQVAPQDCCCWLLMTPASWSICSQESDWWSYDYRTTTTTTTM